MSVWVPVYEDLFVGSKANLSGAARSAFIRLCQLALSMRGVVEYPHVGRPMTPVRALKVLTGCPMPEARRALLELTGGAYPMLLVDEEQKLFKIPSWDRWAIPEEKQG